MSLNTNNIEVLTTLTAIKGRAVQAGHADNSAKSHYMSAFISSFIHASIHGDHTIVNTCFDNVPATSLYRNKIKAWVTLNSPLKFDSKNKAFKRKVNDGVKELWTEAGIQSAIDLPFYAKVEKEEKPFNINQELVSLDKKVSKLIEAANTNGVDTATLELLHSVLAGEVNVVDSE